MHNVFLAVISFIYRDILRPMMFLLPAQKSHELILHLLGVADRVPVLHMVNRLTFVNRPIQVGGVVLPHPFILAAGFVKGHGFEDETQALNAVARRVNIMPGWQSMPQLVDVVEYGSFTRYPRVGNAGRVIWRDVATKSTQNRVGLKNPGAHAAAEFLSKRKRPRVYGVNIAVSPGVNEPEQERTEVLEAIQAFLSRGVRPSWFTLNVSCPNTEDDPGDHQTESRTRDLCQAVIDMIGETPLWVKLGPDLAESQYQTLMRVFDEIGVRAVVATNTIGQPTPDDASINAGVGGRRLHEQSVRVAKLLRDEKQKHGYAVDVIGCGGVQTIADYQDFAKHGVNVVQYWSGMVYEGPLLAATILSEL